MYGLFQKINKHGMGYVKCHLDELTPMDCMELLLYDLDTLSFVPLERMNGRAWYYFLLDTQEIDPPLLEKVPWDRIPSYCRNEICRKHPEITVPTYIRENDKVVFEFPKFPCFLVLDAETCSPFVRCIDYDEQGFLMDIWMSSKYVECFATKITADTF